MNKIIGLAIVLGTTLFCEAGAASFKKYDRVKLLNGNSKPLNLKEIEVGEVYVFSYPYKATPSIIIKNEIFDDNNRSSYSISSYLAINPKTFEAINDDISIISFYQEEKALRFCDDKGTYDIASGKNVLDINQTDQELTRVVLEYDENGRIFAVGLSSDETEKMFFKEKKTALIKRYRSIWSARKSHSSSKVEPLEKYSLVTVRCNNKVPFVKKDINSSDNNQSIFLDIGESAGE